MAVTTTHAENQVDQWAKKFWVEYVRANRFKRFMGMDENSIIQSVMDLTRMAGDDVTVSILMRLKNTGVTGDNTLEGNEEAFVNRGYKVTVDQLRNAVVHGKMDAKKTQLDLLKGSKTALKNWAMEKLRDAIIEKLGSPNVDGVEAYSSASEGEKDTWVGNNSDRVLFGNAVGNYVADDHSASLDAIDSTNDTLDTGIISLADRLIEKADPHIRPVKAEEDEEFYVMFVGPLGMRDLESDTAMQQANREARARGISNPMFRGGDLMWRSVLIRKIPEISVITGVGNGGIDVEPFYLCGAQSIIVAWGEKTHAIDDTFDYGNKRGVGIAEIRGVAKTTYAGIQHGVFTGYVSGVADS